MATPGWDCTPGCVIGKATAVAMVAMVGLLVKGVSTTRETM